MHERVTKQAILTFQSVLRDTLPTTENLPAEQAVQLLRQIMRMPDVISALAHSPDNALVFALRETNAVLADELTSAREIVNRLWAFLDLPELNRALGVGYGSRLKLGSKKPPA
jgi:hypothetical protein